MSALLTYLQAMMISLEEWRDLAVRTQSPG
jgi:hypothetical protein